MSNVLLGGCIGDALGMPFESKLSNDPLLLNWDQKTFLSSEHHNLKAGQWTDDSQFSLAIAQSLIDNKGFNPDDLSQRYVELFSSKTIRGYGRTTLMAIQALQSGKHWSQSGVAGSYGNGTAMRAAPFGVYFRNDLKSLIAICKIDSAITHASDEAEAGSIAIALAAAYAVNHDTDDLLNKIHPHLPDSKVKSSIFSLSSMLNNKDITAQQVLRIVGTKADVRMTVPAALYCFLKFDNCREAVLTAILAGGDTDTTGAVVGALFGAQSGMSCFDEYHIRNVEDSDKLIQLDSQLYNRSDKIFFPRSI